MAKQPALVRPRPNPMQRMQVQAAQSSTLNGQAARDQLASIEEPTPEAAPENEPVAETPAAEPTGEVAPETSVISAAPAAAAAPEASAPSVARKPSGRPTRSNTPAPKAAADTPKSTDAGTEQFTTLRVTKSLNRELRRAKTDLEDGGRKITIVELAEEGINFYLDHLRSKGQVSPKKA